MLPLLLPLPVSPQSRLRAGELEDRVVEIEMPNKPPSFDMGRMSPGEVGREGGSCVFIMRALHPSGKGRGESGEGGKRM